MIRYEYDAAGNKIASVDAEDHRTEFSYTPRNLLDITTFKGVTPEATQDRDYDGVGNLTKLTDEEKKKTAFTYDAENRQRTVTFANEMTEQKYDAVGNRVEVIKPKLNSRIMTYDGLNRLTSVGDEGLTTAYTYDANNNRLSQTDPNNHRVDSSYDELGRLKTQIQRKGTGDLIVSFDRYDAEGNLTERTDAMGQLFKYSYDELNRPTQTTYPDVATPFVRTQQIETTFDANNNVATVTETKSNVTDVTSNEYDDFDRLSSSTQRGMTIGYGYDKNGNRTRVATINGSTDYTFDGRNRLATAQGSDGVSTYSYTPAGRIESVSYANGATSATSYWPSNRIKTIVHRDASGTTIAHFDYEYDQNGNRTRQVATQGAVSETTDYRYDDLDRLSYYSVTGSSGTKATTYTFLGYNRKTEWTTQDGATVISKSYSYDESDWLTGIIDRADPFHPLTITYDYDKNGNTLKKSDSRTPDAALEFSYDAANRLVQSRKGATLTGQYDYNAAGLRVRHYGSERGNIETFYDDGAVLEEYVTGANGGFLAHYRYADRLLSLATPSESQYYHHDALGSTVDLTDQSGSVKVRYTLDPWGEITSQVGSSVNRMVFTGQEHDEQTGLIYFGARYYDPDTARFTTQDSYLGEVGTPPSLHRYLYAYANPTVYVDLMGYASVPPVTGAFYPETDVMSGWNPTIDTGVQLADDALAAVVGVGNMVPAAVNTASFASTTPLMAYAGVTGQTLEEANGEFLNMSMTVPYLGKAAQFLRGGPGLRSLLSAASKTVATVTKEAKDGLKAFGTASIEIKGLGSNLGNVRLRSNSAKVVEEAVSAGETQGTSAASNLKLLPRPSESTFNTGERLVSKNVYENFIKNNSSFRLGAPGTDSFFFNKPGANQATRSYEAAVNAGFTKQDIIDTINTGGNELVRVRFNLDKIENIVVPGISKVPGGIGEGIIPGTNGLYTGKGWTKNYLNQRGFDEFIGSNVRLEQNDIIDIKYMGRIKNEK